MVVNKALSPLIDFRVNDVSIMSHIASAEVKRSAVPTGAAPLFVQAVLRLSSPLPDVRQGDVLTTTIPFAKKLIVQSLTKTQLDAGCLLSIYSASTFGEEIEIDSQTCEEAIIDLLRLGGIEDVELPPPADPPVLMPRGVTMQSGTSYVTAAAQIADAMNLQLYVDDGKVVSVVRSFRDQPSIGELVEAELIDFNQKPTATLPAQKVVCRGTLSKKKQKSAEQEITSNEEVRGGLRTTVKTLEFSQNRVIEKVKTTAPKASFGSFNSNYRPRTSPNTVTFTSTSVDNSSATEDETTITSEYDELGYIVSRTTVREGAAAKCLDGFLSAWAATDVPEPEEGSPDISVSWPRNLFRRLLYEKVDEKWKYDLPRESDPITSVNDATFVVPNGKVSYERKVMKAAGTILPEMGDLYYGYQNRSNKSTPQYEDPDLMELAEVERIDWQLQEDGAWLTSRRIDQATGIRDSSIPQNAMKAFSFPEDDPQSETFSRSHIAYFSATQMTRVLDETSPSGSPPNSETISSKIEYSIERDYDLTFDLSRTDPLLPRTVSFSPSPYCQTILSISTAAEFYVSQLIGLAGQFTLSVPLTDVLSVNLPPLSFLSVDGKPMLLDSVTVTIDYQSAVAQLTCYAL